MKRVVKGMLLLLVAVLLFAGCSQGEEEAEQDKGTSNGQTTEEQGEDEEVIAVAENFMDQLSKGLYEEATELFDETMTEQLGPEELEELWKSVQDQLGEIIDYEFQQIDESDGYQAVFFDVVFNDNDATIQVTLDGNQQIAGFFILE